jgi:hypothetical protein
MSDSDRCRATAARYARLANLTTDLDIKQSYLELERLWLEAAGWTDKLNLRDDENARRRVYELIDSSGSRLHEIRASLH